MPQSRPFRSVAPMTDGGNGALSWASWHLTLALLCNLRKIIKPLWFLADLQL